MLRDELTRIMTNLFAGDRGSAENLTESIVYDNRDIISQEEATRWSSVIYNKALANAGHIRNFD